MNLSNYISKYASKDKRSYKEGARGAVLGLGVGTMAGDVSKKGIYSVHDRLEKSKIIKDSGHKLTPENYRKLRKDLKVRPSVKLYEYMPRSRGPYSYSGHHKLRGGTTGKRIRSHVYAPPGTHPSIYAHEFGHASGIGRNKLWTKAVSLSSLSKTRYGALGLTALSPENSVAEKAGIAGVALSTAPRLAEEARASIRGLRSLKRIGVKAKGSKRILASGLLSYTPVPLATGLMAYGAYKGKRLLGKKDESK
jgi:hypothetical protein